MPNTQQRVVTRFLAAAAEFKVAYSAADVTDYAKQAEKYAKEKNFEFAVGKVGLGLITLASLVGRNTGNKKADQKLKRIRDMAADLNTIEWGKKAAEDVTAGSKKLDESDIKNLKSMTSRNDHTAAYIKGSELVGATHTAKKLELVAKLLKLEGHLPGDLSKYQYQLYQEMLTQAKRTLSPEGYDEFYGCF